MVSAARLHVARSYLAPIVLGFAVATTAACSSEPSGETAAKSSEALAVEGPWRMPADVANRAANLRVTYDEAPLWNPQRCARSLSAAARPPLCSRRSWSALQKDG
jgi:hypothetical protein